MLETILQTACLLLLLALALGSLLNLSVRSHWFIRGWDFPRIQIIAISLLIAAVYFLAEAIEGWPQMTPMAWAVVGLTTFIIAWHLYRVLPYTPLWAKQTEKSPIIDSQRTLRLVISNVEMYNESYGLWIATIQKERPDVVIALETNQRWLDEIAEWRKLYAHEVTCPQENCYGMLMVSRFPILESEVRYLVEDDIPSIEAKIKLHSEDTVRVIAVHPRPPEPIRDMDSAPRDAELMLWGKRLSEVHTPVVLGGDLNDVAWSRTTRLFLRVSDLLDPRRGRALLNSFHAKHWYLRFPLDHVFHSEHFTLRELRRLPPVGSDHFPILIELQLNESKADEQESLEASSSDEELADDLIERESLQKA
ncbi:endonuclease [Roseiconus nitratireducens]|uniref:Endonuclease n=1 Tax=Roseiconus nitratireducens TaxID=2605748 RepID=A0A5M6DA04_9BACT|nr:endonuclease/exonuclease/phosphatase family protein [Roseiconus nitratireducens]KAA5542789.1 endonuclease [Roseiconus nitratireducens]